MYICKLNMESIISDSLHDMQTHVMIKQSLITRSQIDVTSAKYIHKYVFVFIRV